MDKEKKTKAAVVLLVIFVVVLAVCIGIFSKQEVAEGKLSESSVEEITFSKSSGIYEETVLVELGIAAEMSKEAVVYYTLNGDDPMKDSSLYTEPILLETDADRLVCPLKARVCLNGELSEKIYEETYVVERSGLGNTGIALISLTSDSENLYDYETGILVDGVTYEEFPVEGEGVNYWFTGNYSQRGDEWIRDAHITMFDAEGRLLIDQAVGMGISGGTSSVMPVKSFKIMADEVYDTGNPKLVLSYDTDRSWSPWSFVTEYNSLKLRNGSQDLITGNIRSGLISRLAQESGFDGITSTMRAVLYLNGEFYAITDVKQRFNRSYLADRFDLDDTTKVEKLEITEANCLDNAGIKQYFEMDLNNPVNRKQLEQVVDMDNMLLYYAIQVLSNNKDWPQNNFEMWRYTGEHNPYNPYTDGRWRFLIYDTDLTYHESPEQPFEDMLLSCLNGENHAEGTVFPYIMASDQYRNQFLTILCDLMDTSFETDHILALVEEEYEKIDRENRIQYGDEYTDTEIAEQVDWLKANVSAREEQVQGILKDYFGLNASFELTCQASEGIMVSWGNRTVFAEEEATGNYYQGMEIVFTPEIYPGYEFLYWIVNGQVVKTDILCVTDYDIQNGQVSVQAVAEQSKRPTLVIGEISAKGDGDWMKLSNLGSSSISLNDYYVSDDENLLLKCQLPDLVLAPGDSVIINCKNNQLTIGEYVCNFSLNELETIYLSNEKSQSIVDCVSVPKMDEGETYGRYKGSNRFVFYRNTNGQRKTSLY